MKLAPGWIALIVALVIGNIIGALVYWNAPSPMSVAPVGSAAMPTNVAAVITSVPTTVPSGTVFTSAPTGTVPANAPTANVRTVATSIAPADSLCNPDDAMMTNARGLDTGSVNFARRNGYYTWCIPEFDDDQRLSDAQPGSTDYGSIAHVLAKPELATYTDPSQFNGKYVQVGIISLEPPLTLTFKPYSDLGLTGQSCMYLQHHIKRVLWVFRYSWYSAVIVPVAKWGICPDVPDPSLSRPLDVATEGSAWTNQADYPATSRFIEAADGRTLIGIKCANTMCVVGPKGFGHAPESAHAAMTGWNYPQAQIKGWFDDQVLGTPGTGTYGIHRRIRASAIPDPALGTYQVSDFELPPGQYKTVGKTYFPEEPPADSKYVTRYGFSKDTNIVALRAVVRVPQKDTLWFARITNAHGTVTDSIPTHRTDHSKFLALAGAQFGYMLTIPATMRWRWYDTDEDLWAECSTGCCLVGIR